MLRIELAHVFLLFLLFFFRYFHPSACNAALGDTRSKGAVIFFLGECEVSRSQNTISPGGGGRGVAPKNRGPDRNPHSPALYKVFPHIVNARESRREPHPRDPGSPNFHIEPQHHSRISSSSISPWQGLKKRLTAAGLTTLQGTPSSSSCFASHFSSPFLLLCLLSLSPHHLIFPFPSLL